MKYRILKIKDWLKFKKPDHKGFQKHVEVWEKEGIPYGFKELCNLGINYGIKPPKIENGKLIFDF